MNLVLTSSGTKLISKSTCTIKHLSSLPETTVLEFLLRTSKDNLAEILTNSNISWSPDLVDKSLKLMWNDGPKALLFFDILDRNPQYKHSASSFDHAVDIAGRMKDYKALWNLINRMRKQRVGPNARTFAIVIERYVNSGKAERAVKTFISMHKYGCEQNLSSFNSLLDTLCKSKRVELATSLFKTFRKKFHVDTISYNIMINGWCRIKKVSKAVEVSKEMVNQGLNPNLITYNTLIKGLLDAGHLNQAWDFFVEMKKRKCKPDVITYTTVIHGFGVAGEIERARQIFRGMVAEGCLPSVATYNALIQVLCKKDNVNNAIVAFEEMISKGHMPNSTTYNVIIRGLCHVGEFDRAMKFMERMEADSSGPNVQTYNVMIRYLCDEGYLERGFKIFEEMEKRDCLPDLHTYNILISAMFVRKKPDDLLIAGKLLMEMVERGHMPRKLIFKRVLDGLLLTGHQGFAKKLLRAFSMSGKMPQRIHL